MTPTSKPPLKVAGAPSKFWLMQQQNELWIVESPTRPEDKVPRGTKHIVVAWGPGSELDARQYGERMISNSNAVWRS